jgi:esterase/lipase superfamily enzyme
MHVERHAWDSSNTGRTMRIERWGHWGPPLVYLPSSTGDERELERYGIPEIARPWIETGRLQIVGIDGGGPWTLWNQALGAGERLAAYLGVERYVSDELLPWVEATARNPRLALAGTSYGAFLGASLLLRHAPRVRLFCGLGGVYSLWHRLETSARAREVTPLEALARLDEAGVARLRQVEGLELYAAADDEWLDSTTRFGRLLELHGVPHELSIMPSPAQHHERVWRIQLGQFLERRYGPP